MRAIYDFYKAEKQTLSGAKKVKNEILLATREIIFAEQFQKDEIQPEYRRIIVRHYKILYQQKKDRIYILGIFNTYRHPFSQKREV